MPKAGELVDAFADQNSLDPDETMALLAEFVSESGTTNEAVVTLCEWIEEEWMTDAPEAFLKEKGFEP